MINPPFRVRLWVGSTEPLRHLGGTDRPRVVIPRRRHFCRFFNQDVHLGERPGFIEPSTRCLARCAVSVAVLARARNLPLVVNQRFDVVLGVGRRKPAAPGKTLPQRLIVGRTGGFARSHSDEVKPRLRIRVHVQLASLGKRQHVCIVLGRGRGLRGIVHQNV